MNIDEFIIRLEKRKEFRILPEQYKNTKFCKLYMKIYNYMLNIPKEKIVVKTLLERNDYIGISLKYISCFLEAKDFYQWKDRIYNLVIEKIHNTSYKKFKLLYRSKVKNFYDRTINKIQNSTVKTLEEKYGKGITNVFQVEEIKEKSKATCLKIYGKENPMQSKEIQEKVKATNLVKYGEEHPAQSNIIKEKQIATWNSKTKEEKEQIQEKIKDTNQERYGKEYYLQTSDYKEKTLKTLKEKYGKGITNVFQVEEIKEKSKATCLELYGVEYYLQIPEIRDSLKNNSHSKIADDMCLTLDTLYGTLDTEDTKYFTKNGEYFLRAEDNNYRYYDYTNVLEKWIVEFQGTYTHGLLEGQEYVFNKSVEEVHKRDKEKRILAEKNGYKVFYVYEDEYKSNKSKCLENLLKEIKNYVHSLENRI